MPEIIRYIIVGGTGTLLDIGVFALLIHAGADKIVANTISFLIGTAVAFIGHQQWTFQGRTDRPRHNLVRFVIVNCSGLLLSDVILLVAVDLINLPLAVAKGLAIIIAGLTVYLINSRWSFR